MADGDDKPSSEGQSKAKNGSPADNTRSAASKQGPVDPQVLKAIELAMKPVLDAQVGIAASQKDMSRKLDNALRELASVSNKVEALETAAQASSDQMDKVVLMYSLPLPTASPQWRQPSHCAPPEVGTCYPGC